MTELQRALKELEGRHFYEQGGTARFAYSLTPLPACLSMKKRYGVSFETTATCVKEGFTRWFHDIEGLRSIKDEYLRRLRSEDVIAAVEADWQPAKEALVAYCKEIMSGDLSGEDATALAHRLQKLGDLDQRNWEPSVFIDGFDPFGEDIIHEKIRKHAPELEQHTALLITTKEHSYVRKQRVEILKLALRAKAGEDVSGDVQRHRDAYFWYRNSFAKTKALDLKHFEEELQQLLDSDISEVESELAKQLDETEIQKRDALLANAPEELQNVLRFFRWMTVLRDRRKEVSCRKFSAMRELFEALAAQTSIPVEQLEYMAYWEGDRLDDDGFADELATRQHNVVFLATPSQHYVFSGDDAATVTATLEDEVEHNDEVTGRTASPGKVRGTVKVIDHAEEFGKMEQGDVLISTMTRPEFMPILELASAIVTHEGGVTCHAAIVSRELKVPCVIGATNVTKIFKDGDLVEVDADSGVVRKV